VLPPPHLRTFLQPVQRTGILLFRPPATPRNLIANGSMMKSTVLARIVALREGPTRHDLASDTEPSHFRSRSTLCFRPVSTYPAPYYLDVRYPTSTSRCLAVLFPLPRNIPIGWQNVGVVLYLRARPLPLFLSRRCTELAPEELSSDLQ